MNVIYARISNDEQSSSIENQITICTLFASNHNIIIDDIYIDDGYSGSNFNRPGIKRLINDIEKEKISTILIKDLSRIGRCFLETSFFLEYLQNKKKIKIIFVCENINDNDELLLPIKNYLNELYVKECRRKRIQYLEQKKDKVVFSTKGVYGYKINKQVITIDEHAIKAIKIIFSKYLDNYKIKDIIEELRNEKLEIPGYRKNNYLTLDENKYNWKPYMIYRILNTKEYTGLGINLKTVKIKHRRINNLNKVELENRYPVIIDSDTFNRVHHKLAIKRVNKKIDEVKDLIVESSIIKIVLDREILFIIESFKDKIIVEFKKRFILKNHLEKKKAIIEKQIKDCFESTNTDLIGYYNQKILNIDNMIEKELNDFKTFLVRLIDMRSELINYLIDEVKEKSKYLVEINYFFIA